MALSCCCGNLATGQAANHISQRQAFDPDPREHLFDKTCFVQHDVVTGLAIAFAFGDVAITIRGVGKGADFALLRSEPPTATGTFQNLRAFIFGNDALHLQKHFALRRFVLRIMIEKNDFYIMFPEFVQQDNLIRVISCQTIWRMHVNAVQAAAVNQVAETVQRRALKRAAAVTLIQKTVFFGNHQAILAIRSRSASTWL